MCEGTALCLWAPKGQGGAEVQETDMMETGRREGGKLMKLRQGEKAAKGCRDKGSVEKGEKEGEAATWVI